MNPEIIEKILNLVKEGKIEEAENIYKELLAENPNDVNLLTAVGLFLTISLTIALKFSSSLSSLNDNFPIDI